MTYPDWAIKRVLAFLNNSRTTDDILSSTLLKDATGDGYVIGEKVAQNIIDHKRTLPRRRYQSTDDVLAVQGLGQDKLNDLVHSFSISADDAFRAALFDGILYDNWELHPQVITFRDETDFREATCGLDGLRLAVGKAWAEWRAGDDGRHQREMKARIRQAHVATYPDGHLGAFVFAFWWYRFDQDNWFSYERIKDVCENYLGYHGYGGGGDDGMKFALLSLYNDSKLNELTRSEMIPVVINPAELRITVWDAVLND